MAVTALNLLQPIDPHRLPGLLGQAANANQLRDDIWFYLIVLVIASCVIVVFGLIARKLLNSPIESNDADAVIDLAKLRRMHRDGELTDAEFQAARNAVLMGSTDLLSTTSDNLDPTPDPPPEVSPEAPTHYSPDPHPTPSKDIELGPELLPPPPEAHPPEE